MSGALKTTTAITGLAVARNPHQLLAVTHKKILTVLQKMPEDSAYRKHTENIVKARQAAVEQELDVATLELKVNGGQAEELIQQARRELKLARNMLKWKPWEPLVQEAPENQWKWPL